jgi:hypothetical protein
MVNSIARLEEHILQLEGRICLWTGSESFKSLAAYIHGFEDGLKNSGSLSGMEPFQKWIEIQIGRHCSVHWTGIIQQIISDGSDDDAVAMFSKLFKEYVTCYRKDGPDAILRQHEELGHSP